MKVELTDEQVRAILDKLRENGKADNRFDINLAEGKYGEHVMANIIETVEVKRDYVVSTTGNLAVEYYNHGKPSGISITEAEWWGFLLDGDEFQGEVAVLIKTSRLRKIIDKCKEITGGDNNKSHMKLLPLKKLFDKVKK
ncbi:MAG: hypothetical protein H8D65_00975 [Spirochaetes bacterium]|nr:hypothetical protein [Spirochaetota bacterium]